MPEMPNPGAQDIWFQAERAKYPETGILSSLIHEQAEVPQGQMVHASETYAGEQVRRIVCGYIYVFHHSLPQVIRVGNRLMLNTSAQLLYIQQYNGNMLSLGDRDWWKHRVRIVQVLEQALLERGDISHRRSGK